MVGNSEVCPFTAHIIQQKGGCCCVLGTIAFLYPFSTRTRKQKPFIGIRESLRDNVAYSGTNKHPEIQDFSNYLLKKCE